MAAWSHVMMGRFPIASLEMLLRRCPSWLNFYRMVRMNRLEAQQISDSTSLFDDQKRYLMFQKSKRVDMGPKDVEFGWNFQNVSSRVWSLLWGQWSSCGPSLANCVRKPIRQKKYVAMRRIRLQRLHGVVRFGHPWLFWWNRGPHSTLEIWGSMVTSHQVFRGRLLRSLCCCKFQDRGCSWQCTGPSYSRSKHHGHSQYPAQLQVKIIERWLKTIHVF